MAKIHMTPAQYVIKQFNGVANTARILRADPGNVSKWKHGKLTLPCTVFKRILDAAKERGLDITANDLIYGRELNVAYDVVKSPTQVSANG